MLKTADLLVSLAGTDSCLEYMTTAPKLVQGQWQWWQQAFMPFRFTPLEL